MPETCSSVTLSRGGAVTMAIDAPDGEAAGRAPVLVLAHGAGNDLRSPFLEWFATALAKRGLVVVRFNFPYKERAGTRPPDRMDVLADTYHDVVLAQAKRTGSPPGPLFLGGKSMGGRVAAALVARGGRIARNRADPRAERGSCGEALQGRVRPTGLVFLGFPLHKPGEPETLRTDDLPDVRRPMLFVQGTRDPFGGPDEIRAVARSLKLPARLHVVEGGDHSYVVPKSQAGRQQAEMVAAADAVAAFTKGAARG